MSSKRIAINTLATYGRSVLAMGLALFSSRWVLNALGQSDFGLYSVVGSIIVFIVFLNMVMAGSAARFFAFSIGKRDPDEVNCWFNAALSIHICLAFLLVGVGWPVGEMVVRHVLNIPHDRVQVCVWVFRVSLLSAFVSMLAVPFIAMFTAKQHIAELAVWALLQSVLTFALAFSLRYASGDRLLFYTVGMVGIVVMVQIAQIVRAKATFQECRIALDQWFSGERLRAMFTYCSWNLIGSLGSILRDQGSAILLNLYFGPQLNAAYGIASQVSSQTNQLSASMVGAFAPEITASEGRGDRVRMLSLSNQASKLGTLMVLVFAIPLMLEMDYVLKLWLHTPPEHAATFCRFILITFLIDRLSTGFMLAVSAYGRIAAYQATVGGSLLLTLPIAWIALKSGLSPTSVGWAFLLTISITSIGRAFWARRLFGMPLRSWLTSVVYGCCIVAFSSLVLAYVPRFGMEMSFLRLVVVASVSTAVGAISLIWVLNASEKQFLRRGIRKAFEIIIPTRNA